MTKNYQDEFQCSQFEALLADALDWEADWKGSETPTPAATREAFEAHGQSCPVCGPLWAETREGMRLLRQLEDVEPPRNLVHNILAATSIKDAGEEAMVLGPTDAVREKSGLLASLRRTLGLAPLALRSRFATSFIMAFFSLSVTLSLAGVKIGDLGKIDWHPNALRKSAVLQFTQLEAKVERYYDNMRLVYEVESRMRGLRKTEPEQEEKKPDNQEDKQPDQQKQNTAPDTSGRPQENENYSQERGGEVLLAQQRPDCDPTAGLTNPPTMNDEGASL